MTRKEVEELKDDEIVELNKEINDFIKFLEKELLSDNNAK